MGTAAKTRICGPPWPVVSSDWNQAKAVPMHRSMSLQGVGHSSPGHAKEKPGHGRARQVAERVGLRGPVPAPRPSGRLTPSKIAPGDFVEPLRGSHPTPGTPKKSPAMAGLFHFGGEGGIRTHVPVLPDHPISNRRRYDRFGTSPAAPSSSARGRTADERLDRDPGNYLKNLEFRPRFPFYIKLRLRSV